MLTYIYDNSFEGIMTCIYYAYLYKENPDRIMPKHNCQISLLGDTKEIKTDLDKAKRVYNSVSKKISSSASYKILRAGLSCDIDAGKYIFEYYKRGIRMGRRIDNDFSNGIVMKIENLKDNVINESHKYKGFLRFEKYKGEIYYAPYRPKNNITPLISKHFKERMKNEKWIIHDKNRKIAAFYKDKVYIITDFEINNNDNNRIEEEKEIQRLWRTFYNSVSIKERENRKLHIQNMPLRYQEFLTEKNNLTFK